MFMYVHMKKIRCLCILMYKFVFCASIFLATNITVKLWAQKINYKSIVRDFQEYNNETGCNYSASFEFTTKKILEDLYKY